MQGPVEGEVMPHGGSGHAVWRVRPRPVELVWVQWGPADVGPIREHLRREAVQVGERSKRLAEHAAARVPAERPR